MACIPCEADEDGACGAIVVLGLLEELLDVVADGVVVAWVAGHWVGDALAMSNLISWLSIG